MSIAFWLAIIFSNFSLAAVIASGFFKEEKVKAGFLGVGTLMIANSIICAIVGVVLEMHG